MSNWIDWDLDVLASNPDEINHISERLNQPSPQLVNWIAQRFERSVSEVAEGLTELLAFKAVRNLGYIDNTLNKARRFRIEFKDKRDGTVRSHLFEISEAFPAAIFLLEYRDTQSSYTGKQVIRAGEVVQEVFDGDQQVQSLDWALLDIFAPFKAEYYGEESEFGSLWQPWLEAVMAAARQLKGGEDAPNRGGAS